MSETWKPIPGFEGHYDASDLGRIKILPRTIVAGGPRPCTKAISGRVLKPSFSNGYLSYVLWKEHVQTTIRGHHAVAYAFLGPRPTGAYVCHKDGDRTNNCLANLYYGSPADNMADARRHGTLAVGEAAGSSRLSEAQVQALLRAASNAPQSDLARQFGISQAQVSRIVNRQCWRHVNVRGVA